MQIAEQRRWYILRKICKQDKVGGIHRLRMKADAGNPRFLVCGTEEVKKPRGRPTKIGIEKHFYIADSKINEHIE